MTQRRSQSIWLETTPLETTKEAPTPLSSSLPIAWAKASLGASDGWCGAVSDTQKASGWV